MNEYGITGIMLGICLAAALIPAIVLLIYIYKQDWIEKEPKKLLGKLVLFGCLSAFAAGLIEFVAELLIQLTVDYTLFIYPIFIAIMVGAAEEGMKYVFLKLGTWKNPAFDYKFDAIIYATYVSLGFAALENVGYVFQYGLTTAFVRAFISIPGHFGFAVAMGYFYGAAKEAANSGNNELADKNKLKAYVIPLTLHAIFDGLLFMDPYVRGVDAVFLIFIVIFYIYIFRLIRKESKADHAIGTAAAATVGATQNGQQLVQPQAQPVFNQQVAQPQVNTFAQQPVQPQAQPVFDQQGAQPQVNTFAQQPVQPQAQPVFDQQSAQPQVNAFAQQPVQPQAQPVFDQSGAQPQVNPFAQQPVQPQAPAFTEPVKNPTEQLDSNAPINS